ncbi:MAG: outer membrane protein transport protein [Desulfuromonadales bacterium]|nr:outer membrane protein transport protein [Desulfuromonadales bacterium]
MRRLLWQLLTGLLLAGPAFGSGFGVFTQGASGLGQANAVVAHPTGPSSLYFNPALLNDVPGRQVEIGTTGIYDDRKIRLDSGGSEEGKGGWEFPSSLYYTHQVNDGITAGIGVFFPFGLSTQWDDNYEGRYLGTYGDVLTMNINPAVSWRVTDKLSLAVGVDLLYLDATLKKKINQDAAYALTDLELQFLSGGMLSLPTPSGTLGDISQSFEGDGWGVGYNLGALYKVTDQFSIGAAYRSHIDVEVDGDATFRGVDPVLASFNLFPNTGGTANIRLPAQATAAVAVKATDNLTVEVGVRWEDWDSTRKLEVRLDQPVFNSSSDITQRNWKSTWSYNIGGQYRLNDTVALNAGYLYGQNAVPDATFEPLIPDSDAHLFTLGTDLLFGPWTVSAAFGYERHENRRKANSIADPAGAALASLGVPATVATANGVYETDIYLVGLSLGYRF